MIRQIKLICQGHAANEVMGLGFKPRPRGGDGREGRHASLTILFFLNSARLI